MSVQNNITKAVVGELFRIFLFIVYYLIHIALGISLFFGAFYVNKLSFLLFANADSFNVRLLIFALIINIAVWIIAAMVGFYLIKPLFKFTKSNNPKRLEITEQECPQLFQLIRETARKTGCKMPKHVYLSPDVNACVFYNTSFWSIFFPVRKNLEIGLGLFDRLNVSELQSIIAHEFGHFAQNSMKVGSAVYITNTILYNLVCTDDGWDNRINRMRLSDYAFLRYAGYPTYWITNLIGKNTRGMYRFVQKGYLKLSRQMEFDADKVACELVGTQAFVSAMSKLDIMSFEDDQYRNMLSSLLQENKIVTHIFRTKQISSDSILRYGWPQVSHTTILSEPHATNKVSSKLQMDNIWDSHPSTLDRIKQAKDIKINKSIDTTSAWELVPQVLQDKMSEHLLQLISTNRENLTPIQEDEFQSFIIDQQKNRYVKEHLVPFFGRETILFNIDEVNLNDVVENPFTEDNAVLIEEFNTLVNDYQQLAAIKNKQIEAKEVRYDGVLYTNMKKLPLEKLEVEYNKLVIRVQGIDRSTYTYLCQQSDEETQKQIVRFYEALIYMFNMEREVFPKVRENREIFINELNRITRRDEEEYRALANMVLDMGKYIKDVMNMLDFDIMTNFVHVEELALWKKFLSETHEVTFASGQISTTAINEMLYYLDRMLASFEQGPLHVRAQLSFIAEKIIPAK